MKLLKIIFSLIILIFFWNNIFADDVIAPIAQELRFFDNDWNNKIDTIYIKFSEVLIWSFVSSKFKIKSKEWWLATYEINNLPFNSAVWGIIWDNDILKIEFEEYDKTWTWLLIENDWDSDLRISISNWIWIKDLFWHEIDLWYTDFKNQFTTIKYWTFEEIWCSWENCISVEIEENITWFGWKTLKIPLIANNFENIWWLELDFEYDNSQLNCTWIESDILNNSWDLNVEYNEWNISLVWDDNNSWVLWFWSWKLLDINCNVVWNSWDWSNLNLKINELWDWSWNDLSSNVLDSKTFFIQENVTIWWKILNPDWSVFLWWNVFLENKSVINKISNIISSNVWYLFWYLVKDQNYELKAAVNDWYEENTVWNSDVLKIQKHIIKSEEFSSWYDCAAADVNWDGKISVLDIIKIRRYLALNTALPSWNFKFYNWNISCENLWNLIENVEFNNLDWSKSDIIFTKIRMWNVEN